MVEKEEERAALTLRFKRVDNRWEHVIEASVNTSPNSSSPMPSTSSLLGSSPFEPPQSKKPRRIAHVPKGPTPHHRPLTPSSKSPSAERSPYNGLGNHINPPGFSLDGILTPTSISPNEEVEIDPIDQIVSMIVNWDADKIMDKRYKNEPYHTNLAAVPQISFDNFDYYQKCVPFSFNYIFLMCVTNCTIAFYYKCSDNC